MRKLLFIFSLLFMCFCQRQMADSNAGMTVAEKKQDMGNPIQTTCPDKHHPHMIDLGLPSGTKWACCNVDALSPEESGGYYAWGETEEKEEYYDVTYLYCKGDDPNNNGWYDGTIEWISIGTEISGTKYDVAHVKWGGQWQMPTSRQFRELTDGCTCRWIRYNDTNGQLFISKSNGHAIFLPAAGCRLESDQPDNTGANGPWGGYWSGTRHPSDKYFAYYLNIIAGKAELDSDNMWGLVMGFPIRPVMVP